MGNIIDIFGNKITVTDLNGAIEETTKFVGWSRKDIMIFDEFKLLPTTDIYGKRMTYKQDTKSGHSVTNLQYYSHQLEQLNQLKN